MTAGNCHGSGPTCGKYMITIPGQLPLFASQLVLARQLCAMRITTELGVPNEASSRRDLVLTGPEGLSHAMEGTRRLGAAKRVSSKDNSSCSIVVWFV